MKVILFPRFSVKYLLFLFFFIISFLKLIIRKWIDDNNKDISQRLLNIYIYTISDLFSFIPIIIIEFNSKKKLKNKNGNIIERKELNPSFTTLKLIYNDEQNILKKSRLKRTFIVAFADFIAQLIIFIFYFIKQENKRDVEEYYLNTLLIFKIISLYILSRLLLNTYFYKHHYFSFIINIICLIILTGIDLYNINKDNKTDFVNIIIYISIKIFSTIFYSFENVYGKRTLMKEILSPYSLLIYKGIFQIIFLVFLSIPLIFIETKDANDNYKKSIIFTRIFKSFNYYHVIKNISLMIINFFYNILIWIIIDKFSPSHIGMANILESFGASLYLIIFEKEKSNNWTLVVTFTIYFFLIIGTFIHNEFFVINVCGLGENTNLFLDYKAKLDLLQSQEKGDSSYSVNNSNEEKENEDDSLLFEMEKNQN